MAKTRVIVASLRVAHTKDRVVIARRWWNTHGGWAVDVERRGGCARPGCASVAGTRWERERERGLSFLSHAVGCLWRCRNSKSTFPPTASPPFIPVLSPFKGVSEKTLVIISIITYYDACGLVLHSSCSRRNSWAYCTTYYVPSYKRYHELYYTQVLWGSKSCFPRLKRSVLAGSQVCNFRILEKKN